MIYVGENKSVLCKGDFRPAELYKDEKKIAGYERVSIETEDNIAIADCYNDKLHDVIIEGNTIQDGVPTPESPIEIQNVGEFVTEGDNKGKYKVSVECKYGSGAFSDENSIDIYLNEPLRKLGDFADCIDFDKGVVVRKIRDMAIKDSGSWSKKSNVTDDNGIVLYRYEKDFTNKRLFKAPFDKKGDVLCNGLTHVEYAEKTDNSISERPNPDTGSKAIRILTSNYSTASEMKEGFGELVFYYILNDDYVTEEPIELPEIPTKYGCTNTYEITNAVKPKLKAQYKKIIKEG